MATETTIYNDDKKSRITTIDGALMPPVGAKVIVDGWHYVVSEPPEIYIEPADDQRDSKISIYVTVKEG